jgi:predicted unusual protein kinase regulating ubiquinone biosynthesis (AarF/ABC1/UbiB family)
MEPEFKRDQSAADDGIAHGRVRRAAPLAALTARTAGEAVVAALRRRATGRQDPEFVGRAAERYAELLGRSKGALMKAGQALSFVSIGPAVPSEFQRAWQTALSRLRTDAPPMAPELARGVLERELGKTTEEAFAHFDWEPLAAASIGQVHAAQLPDGRRVAVKIQYPGVAAAIRDDLRNTELLSTFLSLIGGLSPTRLRMDFKGVAREIEARVTEELDYRQEAASQAMFADLYRGHPFIHVPDVVGQLCTDRVLTQELVEGLQWSEALVAPADLRDSWAEVIHRFSYGSFHRFAMFNADPHPGNYIFHDDGSVSFLDFGCVKRFHRGQVEMMDDILRSSIRGDMMATWRACVEAGWWSASDPVTPAEIYEYWRIPFEMYWGEQPFTVTPEYVAGWIERRFSPTGPSGNAFRYVTAQGEYTIMGRLEASVMSVIAELRPTNYWAAIYAEQYEGALPMTALGKLNEEFFDGGRGAVARA